MTAIIFSESGIRDTVFPYAPLQPFITVLISGHRWWSLAGLWEEVSLLLCCLMRCRWQFGAPGPSPQVHCKPSACNSASQKQPAILISFAHDTFVCAVKLNVGGLSSLFGLKTSQTGTFLTQDVGVCILVGKLWNNGLNWDIVIVHMAREWC